MILVYMVQVARQRWQLVSKDGVVIQEDILIYNKADADDWVRRYVSSFTPPWHYEIKEKK